MTGCTYKLPSDSLIFLSLPKSESESEVVRSCPTLCNPMDCSLSGSSVHGIFQARVLEWIAISFSRGFSRPRNRTRVSFIAGGRFTVWATREAPKRESCSVVSDSLRPWILQVRILEWIAFPFSRGSSQPRDRTQVSLIAGGFFTSWATREAIHQQFELFAWYFCLDCCYTSTELQGELTLPALGWEEKLFF